MHKHSRCDYTMCSSSYFTHKKLPRNRILRTGIPSPRVMWIRNKLINNSYLVKVVIFQVASETAALNTGAILLRQYSIKFIYSHSVPHRITTFPLSEVLWLTFAHWNNSISILSMSILFKAAISWTLCVRILKYRIFVECYTRIICIAQQK